MKSEDYDSFDEEFDDEPDEEEQDAPEPAYVAKDEVAATETAGQELVNNIKVLYKNAEQSLAFYRSMYEFNMQLMNDLHEFHDVSIRNIEKLAELRNTYRNEILELKKQKGLIEVAPQARKYVDGTAELWQPTPEITKEVKTESTTPTNVAVQQVPSQPLSLMERARQALKAKKEAKK